MKWDLSFPSSVVSSLLVLVVDVIALWFLDRALLRISAFLNAGEVYDARKSIKTSDVWFKCISGRSYAPVSFRKTQVAVKLGMLVCSIAVGLSIDGVTQKEQAQLVDQTVLVPRVRRKAQLGIGGLKNFSSGVRLVVTAERCRSAAGNDSSGIQTVYWNARSINIFVGSRRKENATCRACSLGSSFRWRYYRIKMTCPLMGDNPYQFFFKKID